MAGNLTLRVITPERIVLDVETAGLRFPAIDGSTGVLPGHAALVSALGPGELRYDSIKAQRATSGESAGPAFPLRLLRSCDRFGDKFCVTCDETDDAGTPLTMLLRAESKETAAFWCSALLWLAHLRIDAPMRGVGGQRRGAGAEWDR